MPKNKVKTVEKRQQIKKKIAEKSPKKNQNLKNCAKM